MPPRPQDPRTRRYTGDVIRRPFAVGSKSERIAVMLSTRYGEFVLRLHRSAAPAGHVPEDLVGKRIRVVGILGHRVLTVLKWKEV